MSNNTKSNFYKLISCKNIVIPIIQRDYVQGKTTSKINGIRKGLICDMIQSLEHATKIDFQYIYGIYKEGEWYLPIDGQQRLTSMFLFTWGIAILAGKEYAKKLANLKKFSYQVREASSDFFRCMLELDVSCEIKYFDDFYDYMKIKVKNFNEFSWFKGKWQSDQTVRSSLVFLDSLRKELKKIDENLNEDKMKKYLDCILNEDNCPFEFYLIAQNEVRNDSDKSEKEKQDEAFEAENRAATTYINMNARGKALNEFENFKALLHKCEYKSECKYDGKEFISSYESDYIHTFVKYIDNYNNKNSNLSLVEKIEKMDEFTLNLLMNIYNDIWKIKNVEKEEQKDIYSFMNYIKEQKCECSSIFANEYFEFIKDVMNRVKPDKGNIGQGNAIPEFDDFFYFYCNNHTYRDRWNFMIKYWCPYRLSKEGICEDGWNVFCSHLDILCDDGNNEIALRWCQNAANDKRFVLNRILDELCKARKNSVEEFLKDIDVEDFLYKVCGSSNENDNLNLTFGRIMEEKIKANIYVSEKNNDLDVGTSLNVESQIRYLLYLAGYYDVNGNYNASGDYNKLKIYIEQHQNINQDISQPSMLWRKAYYMTAVNLSGSSVKPPTDAMLQCWNDSTRYWKGKEIPRKELDRVKSIFDNLNDRRWTLEKLIDAYQNKYTNISCWLYYLLRRDMVEIINGLIKENNCGYYEYSNRIYYEYILEKDLCANNYVIADKYMREKTVLVSTISPRPGKDDQTRNRNPEFVIAPYYVDVPNNIVIKSNEWYRFKFIGFDKTQNNEDMFSWEIDQNFDNTISSDRSFIEANIIQEIESLNNEDLCDLIYQRKTSDLLEKLQNLQLRSDWIIESVNNEGAYNVKIKVKCSKKPFIGTSILNNHSEII